MDGYKKWTISLKIVDEIKSNKGDSRLNLVKKKIRNVEEKSFQRLSYKKCLRVVLD